MSVFQFPPGTGGDGELVRVGITLLRGGDGVCPLGAALKARPGVKQEPPRSTRKPMPDFALAPWGGILDLVDRVDGTSVERAVRDGRVRSNCAPAHLAWAAEAARRHIDTRRADEERRVAAGHPPLRAVRYEWVARTSLNAPDARGGKEYQRTAWGRRYVSEDGSRREIWLPSFRSVRRDRSPAEIAAAAFVLAVGEPMVNDFGNYSPADTVWRQPDRVRVVGIGLGDGSTEVLADWTHAEAVQRYALEAKRASAEVVSGTEAVPGQDCVGCEALSGCSAVPRVPGLLGVPAPPRPRRRRSVSVSDLRAHAACPSRYYLTRVLKLGDSRQESVAIRRGRAVDRYLNEVHGAEPRVPCRHRTLPESLPGLSAEEVVPALAMLAEHRAICPLDGLDPTERVVPQRRLVAWDPIADVVVIADCDLFHTDRGGTVIRETKTSVRPLWTRGELVRSFPQLALAVLLMDRGVLGGDPRRSRVELEVLRPQGVGLEELDPGDELTRERSRRVIADLAGPWSRDEGHPATPGARADCAGCEVRRWCPDAAAENGTGAGEPEDRA
ncbi:PD-(D/E)XK nuclease family protein [Streptomyces sp. NPDC004126]|uniref:PD-(D/E)XK nuclease family protein n=1 Tax=Streptomyces sp. NPDC004126 TaxID=3390695 RepID=UPI003D0576AF